MYAPVYTKQHERLWHYSVRQLYPTLRNAIVLGMHYPDGYLDGGADAAIGALGSYSFAQYQTHRELGWAALALCARLGDAGHVAIPLFVRVSDRRAQRR